MQVQPNYDIIIPNSYLSVSLYHIIVNNNNNNNNDNNNNNNICDILYIMSFFLTSNYSYYDGMIIHDLDI